MRKRSVDWRQWRQIRNGREARNFQLEDLFISIKCFQKAAVKRRDGEKNNNNIYAVYSLVAGYSCTNIIRTVNEDNKGRKMMPHII